MKISNYQNKSKIISFYNGMVEEGNKLLDKNLGQVVEQQSAMLNADMTGKAKQKEIANEETSRTRRQENVFKKIAV